MAKSRNSRHPFSRQELEHVLAQLRSEVTRDDTRSIRYTSPLGPTPGVTTVLKELDKPALMFWASKIQSEACETEALEWLQAPAETRGDLLRRLQQRRQAHKSISKRAADAGVEGHRLAEYEIRRALRLDAVKPELEHPREATLICAAIMEWAQANDVEWLAVEQPVWSKYGYAGTMDWLALTRGALTLGDWKSNDKGKVYRESYLQNIALRGALREHGLDVPQGTVVVVPRDGQGEINPVNIPWRDLDYQAFLGLVAVHRWAKEIAKEIG